MVQQEYDTSYLEQLENELQIVQKERRDLANAQMGMYDNYSGENNLVKWQLNLEEEKERIFHLLKGDRKTTNDKGQEMWVPPESSDSAILNDYGIDYIMGLLESFLNRNIILSDFDVDRIKEICFQLGTQITEDIYNDYEKMGFDTDDKRKKASIIVYKVLINIEAALRRAMDNGERLSLRKIMTVTQNDSGMRNNMNYPIQQQQKKKIWNPSTW